MNDVVLGTDTQDLTSFSYFQGKTTFLNFKLQSARMKVKLGPEDSPIKNWLISTRLNTEKNVHRRVIAVNITYITTNKNQTPCQLRMTLDVNIC